MIVEAWSAATEGFGLDPKIRDLLGRLGGVEFYGMGNNDPLSYIGAWGGPMTFRLPFGGQFTVITARSLPDMAANRAGLQFWNEILKSPHKYKFDICKFVNDGWLEAFKP
jgi:hypothetical protein